MEEPARSGKPIVLAVVLVVALVAVGVAVWSGQKAMRGPEEIIVPMPPDIPYDEYLRQQGASPPGPGTPAPEGEAPPAAPEAPEAPQAPEAPE